jgi:ABC-2 type transport system permease protein
MYSMKLLAALLKVNIQQELAYRADTAINIALSLMWLGWELLSLSIIFGNTTTLGGWGPGELLVLLGVWRLINTLMAAIIWPNTERFNKSIRDGSLDYTLLMPVNSLLLVSLTRIVIWRVWDILLAAGLIVGGLLVSGTVVSPLNFLSFLALAVAGALVLYSLWIVLIACTFWFVKFDNNVTILQALMDAGRYPATVYPVWLRMLITFVVPVAVATTVPVQALRGDLAWWQVLIFLGVALASALVALVVWRAGVRRYSGASS